MEFIHQLVSNIPFCSHLNLKSQFIQSYYCKDVFILIICVTVMLSLTNMIVAFVCGLGFRELNMEVKYTSPGSCLEDAGQATENYRGNWQRRLRLRKSSALSLPVKSTTEEEKVVAEPPKEPPQTEAQNHQAVHSSSSKLTFTCSDCKDNTAFSPQGLLNHFTVFHGGKGDPPAFPCDMCSFATPELTVLQQHRMKHKEWRLACEICNDNVLQTLSQLRKHCKTQHSLNGEYYCEKCTFSTKELKVFVHHSCSTSAESLIDSIETSGIKPTNGESNTFHLAAGDEAPQKEELLKHMPTGGYQGWRRKKWWKKKEVPPKHHDIDTPEMKVLFPKPETQWTSSEFLPFKAGGLLDENGVLLNAARTLEETQQFLERTVNSGKKWPMTLKDEPQLTSQSCDGSLPLQSKGKQHSTPVPGRRNSGQNQLSGLIEKNNISVPPDCTTKLVGFKMVDGKKHLVLKVIPSAKQSEVSPEKEEVSSGLNSTECTSTESGSQNERLSDQTCPELSNKTTKNSMFSVCDATSSSGQPEKQCEQQLEDPTEDAPQVDNTENDCNDQSAFTEMSGAQVVSGSNVANIEKQSPDVSSDSNNMQQLHEVDADMSVEESSLRDVDVQLQNRGHTDDLLENCPEFTTCQNASGCNGDLAYSIPSNVCRLEEGLKSQLSNSSEEERRSEVDLKDMDNKSEKDAPGVQSPVLPLNKQNKDKMPSSAVSCSPTNGEKEAIFELNITNPTFVSLHKHTTEALFNSPSENGGLLFQDSCDEYTNRVDPRDAPLPLERSCTSETVEDPNYSAILPGSCHNPDLYQTLEELPVTTVNHLLDDPEVTSRGEQ